MERAYGFKLWGIGCPVEGPSRIQLKILIRVAYGFRIWCSQRFVRVDDFSVLRFRVWQVAVIQLMKEQKVEVGRVLSDLGLCFRSSGRRVVFEGREWSLEGRLHEHAAQQVERAEICSISTALLTRSTASRLTACIILAISISRQWHRGRRSISSATGEHASQCLKQGNEQGRQD